MRQPSVKISTVAYCNPHSLNHSGAGVSLLYLEPKAGQSHDVEKVIHDFRSSLNVIIGYSELMLDGVMGKMTEEQRVSMEDILKKSRHLADMVNNIVLR
jgi:signal transduction histidine kinase